MEVKCVDGKESLVIPLSELDALRRNSSISSVWSNPPPRRSNGPRPSLDAVKALCQGAKPELWCDGEKRTDIKLYVGFIEEGNCDATAFIPANGVLHEVIEKKGEDPMGPVLFQPEGFRVRTGASDLWQLCLFTNNKFSTDERVELWFHDASIYFSGVWTVERKDGYGKSELSFTKTFRFNDHVGPFTLSSFRADLNDPAFPVSQSSTQS